MHVHVYNGRGEAKFWLEPEIELAKNYGLTAREIRVAQSLILEHKNEIRKSWRKHFPS